jgi:hypothetical protein
MNRKGGNMRTRWRRKMRARTWTLSLMRQMKHVRKMRVQKMKMEKGKDWLRGNGLRNIIKAAL